MCHRFCVDLDCPFYCSLILLDCLLQLDPSMDVVVAVAVAVTTLFAYGTGVLHGRLLNYLYHSVMNSNVLKDSTEIHSTFHRWFAVMESTEET